jgi:hypothetical protein
MTETTEEINPEFKLIEAKIAQLETKTTIQLVRSPIITKSENDTEWKMRSFQWLIVFPQGLTQNYYLGRAHVTPLPHKVRYPSDKAEFRRMKNANLTNEGMKHFLSLVRPNKPKLKDVLYSLTMDASATEYNFKDWCDNFGYSDDSIEALNTYKECLEIGEKLRKLGFNLRDMQEFFQDY